jgi:hypothetical protein
MDEAALLQDAMRSATYAPCSVRPCNSLPLVRRCPPKLITGIEWFDLSLEHLLIILFGLLDLYTAIRNLPILASTLPTPRILGIYARRYAHM